VLEGFNKGDKVEAKILDIDLEKERISLGIKQLTSNPVTDAVEKVRKGDAVTCIITAVTEQGLEVHVGDTLSGFIRRGDLARDRSDQRVERFAVGEKVDAVISQIDNKNNKLTLSIKAREMAEEKQAMAEFGSSDSGASLGDILGAALAKKDDDDSE
jgi:small subunit ribosomal protein S1